MSTAYLSLRFSSPLYSCPSATVVALSEFFYLFLSALFARWVTYAQEEKIFRKMYFLTGKQNRLKILLRCFLRIKTRLSDKRMIDWMKYEKDCFSIVRVTADLHQMSKRFFAIVRKSLCFRIKKCNAEYLKNIKIESKHGISFRLFKINFKYEINKRLTEEQRILSESFCTRGEGFLQFIT